MSERAIGEGMGSPISGEMYGTQGAVPSHNVATPSDEAQLVQRIDSYAITITDEKRCTTLVEVQRHSEDFWRVSSPVLGRMMSPHQSSCRDETGIDTLGLAMELARQWAPLAERVLRARQMLAAVEEKAHLDHKVVEFQSWPRGAYLVPMEQTLREAWERIGAVPMNDAIPIPTSGGT